MREALAGENGPRLREAMREIAHAARENENLTLRIPTAPGQGVDASVADWSIITINGSCGSCALNLDDSATAVSGPGVFGT